MNTTSFNWRSPHLLLAQVPPKTKLKTDAYKLLEDKISDESSFVFNERPVRLTTADNMVVMLFTANNVKVAAQSKLFRKFYALSGHVSHLINKTPECIYCRFKPKTYLNYIDVLNRLADRNNSTYLFDLGRHGFINAAICFTMDYARKNCSCLLDWTAVADKDIKWYGQSESIVAGLSKSFEVLTGIKIRDIDEFYKQKKELFAIDVIETLAKE